MVSARRKRRARGMTLIEVMVALLIATVGLLGALAMVGTVIGGTSFSRAATEATVLAQAKIEEVQTRTLVTLTSPANGVESTESNLDAHGGTSGIYTRTTTWGLSADGLRRTVAVQVQWSDPLNRTHYVTAQTERVPNK